MIIYPEVTLFNSTAGLSDEKMSMGSMSMKMRKSAKRKPEQHFSDDLRLNPNSCVLNALVFLFYIFLNFKMVLEYKEKNKRANIKTIRHFFIYLSLFKRKII